MTDYEKLGAFYLGRRYDLYARERTDETILLDAKDLTTHALCVGMTGSGKTGLCVSLIEEAIIDGVPVIAVDPKGDLGNLLLAFPNLAASDFEPWIDPAAAARAGQTAAEFASAQAQRWREGLAEWDQTPERIGRFRDAATATIYTPGGSAGIGLSLLGSFAAPDAETIADREALGDRVAAAVRGLCALLQLDVDPLRSREYILLANLFEAEWRGGRSLDLPRLIRLIQQPPFSTVGVLDLETFYPEKDRGNLALLVNNLLASPSFAAWTQGAPLDVQQLLHGPDGKPRLSILSIAHLSDAERMFFVTLLLGEVLAWVRRQRGTSSLRAILYMDEIFGYFPPIANPPSKQPLLTLLKQARAFGVGVVLATQNPVDLDYKGLSNCGTWFLGRLQTERDKARVIEGLEGAAAATGGALDRGAMEQTLSGLGSRVFLMNNVHDDGPVVFETRWALSYLAGPLASRQIAALTAKETKPADDAATPEEPAAKPIKDFTQAEGARLPLPVEANERFLAPRRGVSAGRLVYRPALLGIGRLHFAKSAAGVDVWQTRGYLIPLADNLEGDAWAEAQPVKPEEMALEEEPTLQATFAPTPDAALSKSSFRSWTKDFQGFLYRDERCTVWKSPVFKEYSEPGESEGDFRARLAVVAREQRDLAVEKLKQKYATKLAAQQERIRKAEARIDREETQANQQLMQTAINFGSTLLGALTGRKLASRTNVNKAGTSLRSLGRVGKEKEDVAAAKETLEAEQAKLKELNDRFEEESAGLAEKLDAAATELDAIEIAPRKTDLAVEHLGLVWTPWFVDAAGIAEPAWQVSD